MKKKPQRSGPGRVIFRDEIGVVDRYDQRVSDLAAEVADLEMQLADALAFLRSLLESMELPQCSSQDYKLKS